DAKHSFSASDVRFDNFKGAGHLCVAVGSLRRPRNQSHRWLSILERQSKTVLKFANATPKVLCAGNQLLPPVQTIVRFISKNPVQQTAGSSVLTKCVKPIERRGNLFSRKKRRVFMENVSPIHESFGCGFDFMRVVKRLAYFENVQMVVECPLSRLGAK